jgi:hypothetical protein
LPLSNATNALTRRNIHNKRDNFSNASPSVCVSFTFTCDSTSKFCGEKYLRFAKGNQDGFHHYHGVIIHLERPGSAPSVPCQRRAAKTAFLSRIRRCLSRYEGDCTLC